MAADGSEQLIRYVVEAQGVDKTAAEFRKVADAQVASQTAAQRLSQELRAQSRLLEVEARAADRAAQAQRALAQAQTSASVATKGAGLAFDSMGKVIGKSAQALGALGSAAQGIIPELAGMGGAVARASGVIESMSFVLGGPLGIALGVATAGLGIYSVMASRAEQETEKLKKAAEEASDALQLVRAQQQTRDDDYRRSTDAYEEYLKAYEKGMDVSLRERAQRENERRQFEADLRKAGLTQEEIEDINKAATKNAETLDRKNSGKPKPVNLLASGGALESDLRERDRLSAAIAAEQARSQDALGRYDKILATTSPEGQAKRREERAEQERELERQRRQSAEGSAEAARVRAGEDANEQARTERLAREWARRDKMVTDHHNLLRDSGHEAWTMLGASAGAAFAAMAAGQKVALAEVLGGLGQQLVAAGTGHIFEGIFQSLMLNPLGPEMVAIGTAEAAFGAGLAAAGGGASRGAGTAGARGGGGAASPTYSPSRSEDRTGDRFELHFHSVEKPTDDDMVRLYRGFQQAARNGRIPRMAEAR